MTSNIKIPKISRVNMSETGMKALIGKRMDKAYKFMNTDIKVSKLSVAQVLAVQELANNASADGKAGFELIKQVIKMSVKESEELTDEDFATFPMDELTKLSNEIMKFSGLGAEAGK